MSELKIRINDNRMPKWTRMFLSLVGSFVIPISIGILADSTAMQWVGFVFGCFTMIGLAVHEDKKTTFKSVDEAIAYLNSIKEK